MKKRILTTASYRCSKFVFGSVAVIMLSVPVKISAQENTGSMTGVLPQPFQVVETISIGTGFSEALDEYLSPNTYHGGSFVFRNDRLYCSETEKYFRYGRSRNSLIASLMTNEAGNGSQIEIMGNMFHSWEKPLLQYSRYDLLAGPSVMGTYGVLWNLRNSNNPASAQGWLAAGVGVDNIFRFRIGRLPVALWATLWMPLAGARFAVDYDMPYYMLVEKGLYGKAIHFMCPINAPTSYNDVALLIPLGRNQLSVSLSADMTSDNMGGKRTQITHYQFGVGYVHRFEQKYNGR